MSTRQRALAFLAAGGMLVVGSTLLVSLVSLSTALAILVWWAGFGVGFVLTVWGCLVWAGPLTAGRAVRLALAAVGLFVAAAVLHNVFFGLTGIEEPVFFVIALWLAPCLLVAAIIRMLRPTGGSGPTHMGLSPR